MSRPNSSKAPSIVKKDYTVLLIQLDGNLAPIKLNQENRIISLHLQSSTEKCPYAPSITFPDVPVSHKTAVPCLRYQLPHLHLQK